jgi:hypothetical protein
MRLSSRGAQRRRSAVVFNAFRNAANAQCRAPCIRARRSVVPCPALVFWKSSSRRSRDQTFVRDCTMSGIVILALSDAKGRDLHLSFCLLRTRKCTLSPCRSLVPLRTLREDDCADAGYFERIMRRASPCGARCSNWLHHCSRCASFGASSLSGCRGQASLRNPAITQGVRQNYDRGRDRALGPSHLRSLRRKMNRRLTRPGMSSHNVPQRTARNCIAVKWSRTLPLA